MSNERCPDAQTERRREEGTERRRGNNILGGEGKEENDGAKRRTLKRGERRSHGGLPRRERIPAVKLMMLSKPRHFFIDGWKEGRESGGYHGQ